jgi:copper(I)-binding protein
MTSMIRSLSSLFALSSCIALRGLAPAVAAGDAGSVTVQGAWATPSTAWYPARDVYLTIRNRGDRPDSLLDATTALAQGALVAVSTIDANDFPTMSLMQPLLIPATGETILQPGAIHVVLIGLTQELRAGQSFPMKLAFAHAGTIAVTVRVGSGVGAASAAAPSPAKG